MAKLLSTLGLWLLLCIRAIGYEYPYNTVVEVQNLFTDKGYGSGGSATLIGISGGRGLYVSCAHLFEEGVGKLGIRFPGKDHYLKARLLRVSFDVDLSVIESDTVDSDVTAVKVRRAAETDKEVVAIGYPYYGDRGSGGPHFTKGPIKAITKGRVIFLASPVVHSGFSGGGVFAEDGSLIGVISGYFSENPLEDYPYEGMSIGESGAELENIVSKWLKQ